MTMEQQQSEMTLYPFRLLQNPGDSVASLLYVLDNVSGENWQIPGHQRKPDAWDFPKQRRYVERQKEAITGSHPPGVFLTYQLRPHSSVFLNDGLQRVTALELLRTRPDIFGMDSQDAHQLLMCTTSVQHRHYDSHEDAMEDFQLINYGTHLTPYELCSGYLTYMDNFKTTWQKVITGIEDAVQVSWHRLGNGKEVNRVTQHKMKRQILSMLLRFLEDVKPPKQYQDVGRKEIDLAQTKQSVEWQLKSAFERLGLEESEKRAKQLERVIKDATAMIESIRTDELSLGSAIVPVLHRWLLDFFVWARNNNVPVAQRGQFVRILLASTKGKNQWIRGDQVVTFAFAHLGVLPRLAEWAEMPELVQPTKRRKATTPTRPGYQDSHLVPFVVAGNGQTVKESASINMARGAREMSPSEIAKT
jgi:hypothetical protein